MYLLMHYYSEWLDINKQHYVNVYYSFKINHYEPAPGCVSRISHNNFDWLVLSLSLRVFLKSKRETTLFEWSKTQKVLWRTKDKAIVIRLLALGCNLEKIGIYLF